MSESKRKNALEIKKIDKKIKLDTTTEGFFDCGNCIERVTEVFYSIEAAAAGVGCKFSWKVTPKNIPFAPQ